MRIVPIDLFKFFEEQIRFSTCPKKSKKNLEKEMEVLKRIRDVVSTKIREQERRQPGTKCEVVVKRWLDDVNGIDTEVNALLDKLAESRSCTCCCFPRFNYLLGKEVVHLIAQVHSLVEEKRIFDDDNLVSYDPIDNVPDLSTTMVGRDGKSSEIRGYLTDSEVTTIGIWGMGGIGKTTMLKSIKHELPRNDFHYIIWIELEMSQNDDDILKIQKRIASCIYISLPSEHEEWENARMLANALRSRKSLILIDNVWKKLDFERIGIPFAMGTTVVKILFTTRSERVCNDMKAQKIVRLDSLDEKESRQLFEGNISPDVNLTENISQRVDEILKRCGGVPLVIVTVARTIANYTRVEEWDHAVESLRSSRKDIEGMDDVMKRLKFSYDKLEDDKIKSCLLYLSLYPEGYPINTDKLIKEWVAEGFLDTPIDNSFTRSYRRGVVNIYKLKSICLVEKSVISDDRVKLHDVTRHMLYWIREHENKEVFIVCNDEISDCNYDRWDSAKRNITSLLVGAGDYAGNRRFFPTEDFFPFTPSLRVLDLSGTGLVDIPKSIGELVELRYLNLNGTPIRTLLMELANLKKLKCLDLGDTIELVTIVGSAISQLSALQSLNLCNTKYQWNDVNMTTQHPLLKLEDLRELKNLEDLGVDVWSNSHLDTILSDKMLLKSITRISFVRIDFTTIDMERLQLIEWISQRLPELKDLIVDGCAQAPDIIEIKDDQLQYVTQLCLRRLEISSVTLNDASRPFSRLKKLQIFGCRRLKELSWTAHIPSLEMLIVNNCYSVKELVEEEEEEEIREERHYFPKLYLLKIENLKNLERIHGRSHLLFSALRFLFIENCPKLKQLSFGNDSAKNMEYIKCVKTQWDLLEWENDQVQEKFSPYVHWISPIPSDPIDNDPDLFGKEVVRLIDQVHKLVEERRSLDDDNVPHLPTTMIERDDNTTTLEKIKMLEKKMKDLKRIRDVVFTNKKDLERKMEDLKRIQRDVTTILQEQERTRPGTECKVVVKGWLDDVNGIETEVKTLLDKFAESRSCTFYRSPRSPRVNYLLRKALIERVHELVEERTKFDDDNFVRPIPPDPINNVPDQSTTMVGRDGKLLEIQGYLSDSQVTTIGIWGRGGIGKTTMLKSIKYGLPRNDFHYIIWIEMSQNDDDILKIQRQIALCIFPSLPPEDEERENARMLANALRLRKSLVLIDNVWKKLDFVRIGIPVGTTDFVKILFTTRSERVCNDMKAQKIVRLDSLDEKESRQLFEGNISPDVNLTENISQRVDEILKRCGGVPLVIVTVARTIANYTRVEEWDHAVESLRSSRKDIEGMDDVMKRLKFSYDKLEDDKIKSCLLYLSLYPEGYPINTDKLIKEWVAEGFLDTPIDNSFTRSYRRGVVNIYKLKSICLVEKSVYSDTRVKLHDEIRHMLCWIREHENKEVFIVYTKVSDCNYDRWDLAKRICLLEGQLKGLPETGMPKCPNLTSLIVQAQMGNRIDKLPTEDFFHFTPSLRVLDLSFTGLVHIPKSIGELVELRYLNLHGTRIHTLPMELANLKNLKCLDLADTRKLVTIVGSSISQLSALQSLDLCGTSYQWKSDDVNMTTQHPPLKLEDLRELKNLEDLGVDVKSNSHLDTILCDEKFLKSITRISFVRIDFTTIYLGGLQPIEWISQRLPELKKLIVDRCDLATDILEIKDDQLPLVTRLHLRILEISSVTLNDDSRPFSRLKVLLIFGCQRLKEVSWTARIPSLEVLRVYNCNSVKVLVEEEEEEETREERDYFPKLYRLEIKNLKNLERIHGSSPLLFPALRKFFIENCPKLKRLSFGDDSAKNMEYIKCEKIQWDLLEWENDQVRAKFSPYVHH